MNKSISVGLATKEFDLPNIDDAELLGNIPALAWESMVILVGHVEKEHAYKKDNRFFCTQCGRMRYFYDGKCEKCGK